MGTCRARLSFITASFFASLQHCSVTKADGLVHFMLSGLLNACPGRGQQQHASCEIC